jgi:hypothetical protein
VRRVGSSPPPWLSIIYSRKKETGMKATGWFCLAVTLLGLSACQRSQEATLPTIASNPQVTSNSTVNKSSAPKHTGEGRVYSKENGFSIIPPKNWNKVANSNGGSFMAFVGPNNANFNVRDGRDDGTPTEQIGASVKAVYPSQFKQWKLADEGFITIDGKKSYYISSQFVAPSGQQGPIQMIQYFIRGNNQKVYVLSFGVSITRFDELKKLFNETATTAQTD